MLSNPRRIFSSALWKVPLCLGVVLALTGCVSTASYQILSQQDGPKQTTISVEVSATSTQGNMQTWANHLETLYKKAGKPMLIDFYASGSGVHHLIGTYEGGSVHREQQ